MQNYSSLFLLLHTYTDTEYVFMSYELSANKYTNNIYKKQIESRAVHNNIEYLFEMNST